MFPHIATLHEAFAFQYKYTRTHTHINVFKCV